MRLLIALGFFFAATGAQAQVTVTGRVKDTKGRPVAGASIAIKDSYDGGTSDSTGAFRFRTSEKGQQTFLTTSIGFKLSEQIVNLSQSPVTVEIILKEEIGRAHV